MNNIFILSYCLLLLANNIINIKIGQTTGNKIIEGQKQKCEFLAKVTE